MEERGRVGRSKENGEKGREEGGGGKEKGAERKEKRWVGSR